MKLLLAFLLSMVVLGLMSDRLDGRMYALITGAALLTTGLYYGFQRFML